ncbi:MAG TPA: AAA family ATPase [Thermodesulfovibrionia bacterium]|nr:AAA family ATPase [Thermodesulfovibrionia bacterium]
MKISIPKEAVDKIVHEYQCTKEEAVKAYLDAQDKANEAFNYELSRAFGSHKKALDEKFQVKTFTPGEIKEYLDKYVIGQEEYKKRLSIASAYHFAMVKYLHEHTEDNRVKRFRKKNTLTAGPSGSGKTYCVEILGDLLQVPTLIIDATDYTEAGYVGKNADDMVRELIDMAPGNTRKEKAYFISRLGGLIFVDEIDKKAKDTNLIGHDISREGFQRSVLKLIERKLVPIDNPYSPASQIQELMEKRRQEEPDKKDNMVSTENILFILGGSFQRAYNSLDSIVKRRISHKGQLSEDEAVVIEGFTSPGIGKNRKELKRYYKEAVEEDFIRFGLLPEIVGRAPIKTFVNPLSKNDLIRIMKETEDSILNQYELEFRLFDIQVEFKDDAIDYVASLAENKQTGARALVSVWEDILTDFQSELPGTNHKELIISRQLCERPRDVLLAMLQKSPFLDYIEFFKKEYGIELMLDDNIQKYIEDYSKANNMELSKTIRIFLAGASALNYMNVKGPFQITKEMIEDEKYFDKLFTAWYKENKTDQ